MEEQLFVRIRGQVQGPFDIERLRALVRRGQLSRMHEVSADGSIWKQASNIPELFVTNLNQESRSTREANPSVRNSDDGVIELEHPQPHISSRWYYAHDNAQRGPVSFDELKANIASGNIATSDLVWTDGMKEWAPAHTVAGLLSAAMQRSSAVNGEDVKLNNDVARTLAESRPWTLFIAWVMCLIGSLGLVFGAAGIILGSRWNEAQVIASGGFSVLYGSVALWGGRLLFRYCGDITLILRDCTSKGLDTTLRSLRRFWIFVSIILIVAIVNLSAVAIWAFSIGISLSGK